MKTKILLMASLVLSSTLFSAPVFGQEETLPITRDPIISTGLIGGEYPDYSSIRIIMDGEEDILAGGLKLLLPQFVNETFVITAASLTSSLSSTIAVKTGALVASNVVALKFMANPKPIINSPKYIAVAAPDVRADRSITVPALPVVITKPLSAIPAPIVITRPTPPPAAVITVTRSATPIVISRIVNSDPQAGIKEQIETLVGAAQGKTPEELAVINYAVDVFLGRVPRDMRVDVNKSGSVDLFDLLAIIDGNMPAELVYATAMHMVNIFMGVVPDDGRYDVIGNDGKVTLFDLLTVIDLYNEKLSSPHTLEEMAVIAYATDVYIGALPADNTVDVNKDGAVDLFDVLAIIDGNMPAELVYATLTYMIDMFMGIVPQDSRYDITGQDGTVTLFDLLAAVDFYNARCQAELTGEDGSVIRAAKKDLANLLGVSVDEIQTVSVSAVIWPDLSLGYPEEGMSYPQVITPGFVIVLAYDGKNYTYHTDIGRIVKLDPVTRRGIEILKSVKETAINDLAARLRVSKDEIQVMNENIILAENSDGTCTITLNHPYAPWRIPEDQEEGSDLHALGLLTGPDDPISAPGKRPSAITPPPYGIYTYTIRVMNIHLSNDTIVNIFAVEKVTYFDGSYDQYIYISLPTFTEEPVYKLSEIRQYDKNSIHKATISYDVSLGRVQKITYYEKNSDGVERVKYLDKYTYRPLYLIDPYTSESSELSEIIVERYKGEVRIPEQGPICTFYYLGKSGLEELLHCTFPKDNIIIIYRDNLAKAVYNNINDVLLGNPGAPIMTFAYNMDNYGNIISTQVTYSDGRIVRYEGLVDPVAVVVDYRAELKEKAIISRDALIVERDRILEAKRLADIERARLNSEIASLDQSIDELVAILEEAGVPFPGPIPPPDFMMPPMPPNFTLAELEDFIANLTAAIDAEDTAAILALYNDDKVHLDINDPSKMPAEDINWLITLQELGVRYLTILKAVKEEYLGQLQVIYAEYQRKKEVERIAIEDLAARLRVSKEEIQVMDENIILAENSDGTYTVTLLRPYAPWVIEEAQVPTGAITPQPFGIYTYHVRKAGLDEGSTRFVVDRVVYFDGSVDRYQYAQIESFWGILLRVSTIEQFDRNGNHKATVSYFSLNGVSLPQERVQSIVHYKRDGSIQYTDLYRYDSDGFDVYRYKGEIALPVEDPSNATSDDGRLVCKYHYAGPQGLERLQICRFPDGTYITYSDDLARAVYAPGLNEPIMRFIYYYDYNVGGITLTTVLYADGRREIYKDLIDPVPLITDGPGPYDKLEGSDGEVSDRIILEQTIQSQTNIDGVTFTSDMVTSQNQEALLASQSSQ